MKTIKISLIVLMGLVSLNGLAQQNRTVDSQMNSWYMYFGTHRIAEKWDIHTQYQWRRSGFISKWQQSLAQGGVNYHPIKNLTVSLGYGFMETFPNGKQPTKHTFTEHRIWQQIALKQGFGRVNIGHRFRYEERFIQQWQNNTSESWETNGFKYVNRLRYQVGVTVPVNHKTMANRTAFVNGYEEIFIGFGKNIKGNMFDQNRAYLGVGYKHNAAFTIKLGYLNQWLMKSDGTHVENNHTLQLAVVYNLDLRKKTKVETK